MNARSERNLLAVLALFAGIGFSTAAAQEATASDEKKSDTVKLEKFEVTGSRVKRLDTETPAPVVSYSVKDIEAKGYTNIGDFIQSLPFNTGSANSIYQTASFTRGAATTNLRGLGSQRFLVLVNGRRAVTYALTNSGNRSVFDFNSLPAAAIDSVEFLKDGASAIYGSDAITGVLNVKLKKNYTGLSTSAYYGNTIGHDTGLKQFSVVAGTGTGKTRAMVAFDYKNSASNFLHDYGISTTDYTQYYGTNKGLNQNSSLNWPANLTLSSAQVAAINAAKGTSLTSGTYVITGGQPTGNPALGSFARVATIPNENRYNFAQTFQRYPAFDYMSAYTQVEHEFNEQFTAFGEVSFSDNRTYYAFTPGVINFSTEGLSLPVNSPYNPFGIALTTLLARTNFGPVRKFDTEAVSANMLGGLRGTIMDRWDWEAAATYGFNEVTTVARNAIRATTYQEALNGTLSGFTGSFFNPFGPSANAGLAKALFTSSTSMNKAEAFSVDASVTGTLYTLPAGDIGVAAGVEFRNDRLQTNPDTAAYLGSGGGRPLSGKRDVTSAYVEITAPIYRSKDLGSAELQLAGRYENYSDFGTTTKPKIGLKVRLPDNQFANVILRGSYSESFQAPALGLLYSSQTVGFSAGLLQDPLRLSDPPQQQRIVTGGNPNLLPETAKSHYVGFVVEIPKIKDLSFSFDYFKFRINQVIVTPSATFLLSARGLAQFPNAIVRDNTVGNPGPILFIQSVPSNNPAAYQIYRGFDLGVNYRIRNTRLGDFQLTAEGTRILEIGNDSGLGGGYFDNIGLYNNPRWRGNATVSWSYKDWSASTAADYIGKYFNDGYTALGWGENPYTLVSASVSYRGLPGFLRGTVVTVGANNLFDNLPPVNGRETGGFDPSTYGAGALGRFVYVRVRKDF